MDGKEAETKDRRSDDEEEYLRAASTPDYLARASMFFESKSLHEPLSAFIADNAHKFDDVAEVSIHIVIVRAVWDPSAVCEGVQGN